MNLIPKFFNFKKSFKIKPTKFKKEKRTNKIVFGTFGILSLEAGYLKSVHIETIKKLLSKKLKKRGLYWIRIFPNLPITNKSIGVRMGKGKGNVAYWVFPSTKNRMLFEFNGISFKEAKILFKTCSLKLPLKTKLLIKKKFL